MPTGNKDIGKYGKATQFPHNDPTRGGRKQKIYSQMKELGYSKEDIKTCFGELIFYNEVDLRLIVKDAHKPIIMQIVAKALIEAKSTGQMSLIREILEHTVGKPSQSVEHTGTQTINHINLGGGKKPDSTN